MSDDNANMEKRIEEVMDEFRFEFVHEAMEALDWEWSTELVNGVPTLGDLRRCARSLLRETWTTAKDGQCVVATGGFQAVRDGDILTLEFVLESYTSCVEGGLYGV